MGLVRLNPQVPSVPAGSASGSKLESACPALGICFPGHVVNMSSHLSQQLPVILDGLVGSWEYQTRVLGGLALRSACGTASGQDSVTAA